MKIGDDKDQIDTPALWLDLDKMERNINAISSFIRNAGVNWRPHIKGIKVPAVAHKMLDAGAIGITCSKLAEAEVMADAGIDNILIANQIVGEKKIERLVSIQDKALVMPCVDSQENVDAISRFASASNSTIRVLVEVNTGMDRCGLPPGDETVEFAIYVSQQPCIKLVGLMTWEGGRVAKIGDPTEKRLECLKALSPFVETARLCREHELDISIVSCGGSGDYWISSQVPGVTEIQAGGAVYGGLAYRKWGVDLEFALFALATVISRPTATRAVVDAGRKAMHGEIAMPELINTEGAELVTLHSEHGILQLQSAEVPLGIGEKVDFVIGYGDHTVNLHDWLFGIRKGAIESVWEISARGKIT